MAGSKTYCYNPMLYWKPLEMQRQTEMTIQVDSENTWILILISKEIQLEVILTTIFSKRYDLQDVLCNYGLFQSVGSTLS